MNNTTETVEQIEAEYELAQREIANNQDIAREMDEQMHEYRGWAGDGSGEDDFADYNQNEADDYYNE